MSEPGTGRVINSVPSQVAGEKNLIEGEIRGKRGKFSLASGEEGNNREKAREVYCPQDY